MTDSEKDRAFAHYTQVAKEAEAEARKSLYPDDWSVERAEQNAPVGSRVRVVSGGPLRGCEGTVIAYEFRQFAGSWAAEATVAIDRTGPNIGGTWAAIAGLVPQKIKASKLSAIGTVEGEG